MTGDMKGTGVLVTGVPPLMASVEPVAAVGRVTGETPVPLTGRLTGETPVLLELGLDIEILL
jgi:hypothetical protein